MWRNLLYSGHRFAEEEYDLQLKFLLFNLLMLSNVISASLIGVARLMWDNATYATANFIYVALSALFIYLARVKRHYINVLAYLVLAASYTIVTLILFVDANPLAGNSWYIVLVIASVIFMGRRFALGMAGVSLVTIFVVSLFYRHEPIFHVLIGLIPLVSNIIIVVIFDQLHERMRMLSESQKDKYIQLSRQDALTGIANRTVFFESLDRHLYRAQDDGEAFALLFVDVDDFKLINDRYGHQAGDEVLRIIAQRLRAVLRAQDLLARYGGDEFGVIVTIGSQRAHIDALSRRLIEAMDDPIRVDGRQIAVTLSIGIACAPQDSLHRSELLDFADAAMYEAKKTQGTTACFYAERP